MSQLHYFVTFRGGPLDGEMMTIPFVVTRITVAPDLGMGEHQTLDIAAAHQVTYRLIQSSRLTSTMLIFEPEADQP
jgi:hypothetical protein